VSAQAPFLIAVALGDGTEAEIPAANYVELEGLLGRMAKVCVESGTPTPATVVWRLDRGAPRPMIRAELEEGHLHELPILSG
jgi:hypothetical protein